MQSDIGMKLWNWFYFLTGIVETPEIRITYIYDAGSPMQSDGPPYHICTYWQAYITLFIFCIQTLFEIGFIS